jgi:monofunctional biosynthetic peptidoglycan transglycosylase
MPYCLGNAITATRLSRHIERAIDDLASSRKTAKAAGKKTGRRKTPAKPRRKKTPASVGYWRARLKRWLRYGIAALAVLLLIPPGLSLLYRVEAIHPVSTLMLRDLVTLQGYERDWVEFGAIAPVLVQSVMMSEDGKFCSHGGVDWGALNHVIDNALDGEKTRGASTITMQTAKNLFLWNARSFIRKAMEVPLAIWIDMVLSKKRIMEIYLNIAEWGDGIYGVEAASWTYFGRPASELTATQAALLAVTLPNPLARDPAKPGKGLVRLARMIEGRARQSGAYIECLY